ncbi:MAG: capsule assembly Wzi family protein [Marinilabiliales bacterium]|nr:capsule assembly Wzi family protein [Marinilabiliales bacterium]
MYRNLTLILLMLLPGFLLAQRKSDLPGMWVTYDSYAQTGKVVPFWLRSNQQGYLDGSGNQAQLFTLGFAKGLDPESDEKSEWTYGGTFVAGYSDRTYVQPNQYWLGLRTGKFVWKVGAQSDPLLYGGLSSSNGNIDASNNARPVPSFSFSTNGFIHYPFRNGWFSWKAMYAEGMMWDNNFVENAHLHHKNLYMKFDLSKEWDCTLGLEHYVFWGGVSPYYGQFPSWSEYPRYVLGMAGNEEATLSDQINVAGNQLGSYKLEIRRKADDQEISFYWIHPFEDRSGVEMVNVVDGIWGLQWNSRSGPAFLTGWLYEWMYTLNQSGDPHENPIRGGDNYFLHGEYQSGFTHYGKMMGSPLFLPAFNSQGVAIGLDGTRLWMHHLGAKGYLTEDLQWKALVTYARNFGTYSKPLNPTEDQISALLEFNYGWRKMPVTFFGSVAADFGDRLGNNVGIHLGFRWQSFEDPSPFGKRRFNSRPYKRFPTSRNFF